MKTLTDLIRSACSTHDIRNVLGLASRENLIVCPLPQHVHKRNTPSFSIFWRGGKQYWRCHGNCDLQGDVVDLVGYLRIPGYDRDNMDHLRAAVNLLDDRYEITIPEPEKEVELAGGEWRRFYPPGEDVLRYAASRGLTAETVERFRVGQLGHYMTIPCFEEGVLRGIKMRNLLPCDPHRRFWQLEGSRMGLFAYDLVNLQPKLVFVVKGEIPAMLLIQEGFLACAPTCGEGSRAKIRRWNEALALSPRIVIGDNDEPGVILGKKRAVLFGAPLKFPPEQFQDVDKWYLADPAHARETLRTWEEEVRSTWW